MWTQTIVNLTANTSATLIAANPKRQRLRWMVTGLGDVTIAPGLVTVALGAGLVYGAPAAVGKQGGAEDFQFDVSRSDFSAIANANTTVVIWEFIPNAGIPAGGNNNLNATP